MSTEEKIAGYRRDYISAAGASFDHWLAKGTESPIEQLLLAHMLASGWGPNENPHQNWLSLHRDIVEWGFKPTPWIFGAEHSGCVCVLQLPVTLGPTTYRVDFAFMGEMIDGEGGRAPVRYAVELDGHAFHDRTKEQASRDRRRDRAFAANGWTTLRYTGSDVYRDPGAILAEVVSLANKRCWPWWEGEATE